MSLHHQASRLMSFCIRTQSKRRILCHIDCVPFRSCAYTEGHQNLTHSCIRKHRICYCITLQHAITHCNTPLHTEHNIHSCTRELIHAQENSFMHKLVRLSHVPWHTHNVARLVRTWHDSFMPKRMTRSCAFTCTMTHSHVTWLVHTWHNSFIRDVTHSFRRERQVATHSHVPWYIHVWHDSFIRDMTGSYVTWLMHIEESEKELRIHICAIHIVMCEHTKGHQPFLRQAQSHWFQKWNTKIKKAYIQKIKKLLKDINLFYDKPRGTDFKEIDK